jgi:hypothetical protein
MGRQSNAEEFSLMLGESPGHLNRFRGLMDDKESSSFGSDRLDGLGSRHLGRSWQRLSWVWKDDPFNVGEKLIP